GGQNLDPAYTFLAGVHETGPGKRSSCLGRRSNPESCCRFALVLDSTAPKTRWRPSLRLSIVELVPPRHQRTRRGELSLGRDWPAPRRMWVPAPALAKRPANRCCRTRAPMWCRLPP